MPQEKQSYVYASRVDPSPSIRDRIAPVLYAGPDAPGPLTRGQLETFEQNGFLVLENVFNDQETQLLRAELDAVRENSHASKDPLVIAEPQSGEVRSVFMIHAINDLFRRMSRHPYIVGATRQILADDIYLHQTRINFKPGYSGKGFFWHSDFETWHIEDGMPDMRCLSCTFPLTANYVFNGPLMLIPGSHRYYVSCVGETPEDHYKKSLQKQQFGIPDEDSLRWLTERGGIELPLVQPGSVLLFDCNMMHGSAENITPYPRSNAFFVYNSMKNRIKDPLSGLAPRPEFIASRETIEVIEPADPMLS